MFRSGRLLPADRRATLIAEREGAVYKLDLRLQGGDETVFFDV
jgi:protocatechuate 3,4-dioxygenase, alpha subunit